MKKHIDYAVRLQSHIAEIFDEDCGYYIDLAKAVEDDTLTDLIHAIANVVPYKFYQSITGDKVDMLGFNHIANRLAFQYSTKLVEPDVDEEE